MHNTPYQLELKIQHLRMPQMESKLLYLSQLNFLNYQEVDHHYSQGLWLHQSV